MKALGSRKLLITVASLLTLAGVSAMNAWVGLPDFGDVVKAIVILGGGGTLLQYSIDKGAGG